MSIQVITEASIEDSYIFKIYDENKALTTKLIQCIKTGVKIQKESIEEQLLQIRKSRISPLVDTVLNAYLNDDIEIIFNRGVKIPIALPYILRKEVVAGSSIPKVKATIFISNYANVQANTNMLNIPMKTLYVLMESAYVGLFLNTRPTLIERNSGLMKLMCSIYTTMFIRIMNKEYSLSLNKDLHDDVSFVISRFFLEKIWGQKNMSIVFNTASANLLNTDHMRLREINEAYDDANIQDINDALRLISTLSPRLSTVAVQYVVQRFMTTYAGGSILSMDYLPYLFYVVINTLLGGFLLNQNSLGGIIKEQRSIGLFYQELASAIVDRR